MNCSKALVKNLWDTENVWKGKYAKWFEECARSQAGSTTSDDPQVTATFWDKEFKKAVSEKVLRGTVDPTSVTYCKTIAGIAPLVTGPADQHGMIYGNEEMGNLYKNIFQNAFDYFYNWQDDTAIVYGDNYQWL